MKSESQTSRPTTLRLSKEQRQELAKAFSVPLELIPEDFTVGYLSDPENRFGVPEDKRSVFGPAMIIA